MTPCVCVHALVNLKVCVCVQVHVSSFVFVIDLLSMQMNLVLISIFNKDLTYRASILYVEPVMHTQILTKNITSIHVF